MSTSFPLPLECLHIIIVHLAEEGDSKSLASLLQTNKYVCSAILPVLYRNPFQFLPIDSYICGNVISRLSKLIKVLLCSIPNDRVSDLLRAAYLQESKEPGLQAPGATTTAIPYFSFITSVGIQLNFLLIQRIFESADTNFRGYLERCGHASRYRVEGLVYFLNYIRYDIISFASTQEVCRDLTWALCENAERIRTLIVPLSDITRYLPLVSRFKVLGDITFVLDKNVIPAGSLDQRLTPELQEVTKRLRIERAQHLEDMVSFTQEHRRQHPGVLLTGRCSKNDSSIFILGCPEEYLLRLLQALPPLINPSSLGSHNWTHYNVKAQETNLSFVKSFQPPTPSAYSLDRLVSPESLLQRCRSLERLRMDDPSDKAFQWAVDERRQYNADVASGHLPQQPLVPLRHFSVGRCYGSFLRQIHDVTFAFCDTLETVDVVSGRRNQGDISQEPFEISTYNNQAFPLLPRLSKFKVNIEGKNLCIRPDFLIHCPELTSVHLTDRMDEYVLDKVEHWKPAELPRLTTLDLRGTPAISFHPNTLHSTPELKSLHLRTGYEEYLGFFIPPSLGFVRPENEETGDADHPDGTMTISLPNRPTWTWDWELPKLTKLSLGAEFAYRFQFKMLAGTPSLAVLSLNNKSMSNFHDRTVHLADLIVPGSRRRLPLTNNNLAQGEEEENEADKENALQMTTTNDQAPSWQDLEYVHVPALKSFYLEGSWTFDGQVLVALFSKVMPNITDVNLTFAEGFSLSEWVHSTSTYLHHLHTATFYTLSEPSEVSDVGLMPDPRIHSPDVVPRYVLVERPEGRVPQEAATYMFDYEDPQY